MKVLHCMCLYKPRGYIMLYNTVFYVHQFFVVCSSKPMSCWTQKNLGYISRLWSRTEYKETSTNQFALRQFTLRHNFTKDSLNRVATYYKPVRQFSKLNIFKVRWNTNKEETKSYFELFLFTKCLSKTSSSYPLCIIFFWG